MVCLTGDLHHTSLQIKDQRLLAEGETEIRIARHYVSLIERYNVKVTLYICGRCFAEEWETLEPLATHSLVEVGGHMFDARFPREFFDAYGKATGLWNGPRWYQDWDIGMTDDPAVAWETETLTSLWIAEKVTAAGPSGRTYRHKH